MTDYFALLNEPRRPWIDPELLKQKFLALSAQVHPDRVHQAPEAERRAADGHYAELNTAYNCLREPKDRLRHLLELERGAKPADIQRVPPEMMDWQFEVGRLCADADAFLAARAKITSPILKVREFERGQERVDKLNGMLQEINARREELLTELKTMNPAWNSPARAELLLERVDEIHRLLGYLARWSEQVGERIVKLSF